MTATDVTVVIPSVGRPSLYALLDALAESAGPRPREVIVVDDRPGSPAPPPIAVPPHTLAMRVLRSKGRGPAAARNLGWRHARSAWVAFLDDDVVPDGDWLQRLADDLAEASHSVWGSQGRVRVPAPAYRRPTDWERSTAGLATAAWITADMAYRRSALAAAGGFDERFPRAYREDADLALRVMDLGGGLARGRRSVAHPVRETSFWTSVAQQRGNADDVLMRRLHGPSWRSRADAPRGARQRHAATVAAGLVALGAAAAGRRPIALAAAGLWAASTASFAAARIRPGPRTADEIVRMAATSAAIPWAAVWHTVAGAVRHQRARAWRGAPDLVLFDRDGTLIHDIPYNTDPGRVAPVPGAVDAVDRLRRNGVRVGAVSNQSGIGRGLVSPDEAAAVSRRVAETFGPFDVALICPHTPLDGCACRKPAPGMVKEACERLGVDPANTLVIGDIGSDMEAAAAAGACGVLVPNATTDPSEVARTRRVAPSVDAAVDAALRGAW
jgi:HAD superfamily hydrolase (TIGR01662 family)